VFERPEVPVLALIATLAGVGACLWLLPAEWGIAWRVGAGLILGVATTIMLFANRLIGGADFE
jgi:hypothetical protein